MFLDAILVRRGSISLEELYMENMTMQVKIISIFLVIQL